MHALFLLLFVFSAGAQDLKYYEFTNRGTTSSENLIAATSDATLIARIEGQLALPETERNLFISGAITAGNAGYNKCWSWHFETDGWELTAAAIELCDGIPSMVEADLAYWLDTVGAFCPWGSRVLKEVSPVAVVKGDVDNDRTVDLSDAIISLKVISRIETPTVCKWADINGDFRIGIEEAMYALRCVADLNH